VARVLAARWTARTTRTVAELRRACTQLVCVVPGSPFGRMDAQADPLEDHLVLGRRGCSRGHCVEAYEREILRVGEAPDGEDISMRRERVAELIRGDALGAFHVHFVRGEGWGGVWAIVVLWLRGGAP
jgi:hypothetical protein